MTATTTSTTTVRHRLALADPGVQLPTGVSRRCLGALLGRLRRGTLVVRERGATRTYGDGDGPEATVEVRDPSAWSLALTRGSRGIGEAYVDGALESDDLCALLRLLARNLVRLNLPRNRLSPLVESLRRPLDRLRRASAQADASNVRAHYDVGDDFFQLFLDDSMAYSCAVFPRPDATLEEAQREKFERICQKLSLTASDHVVEIGTGWGGFAAHAARTRGCRVTTTTVSANQYAAARARLAAEGLEPLVDVRDLDWRALDGRYTRLVSVEMIEAVDFRDYDAFFGAIERLLEPSGSALVQAILIGDGDFDRLKRRDDFLKTYIFPGGCLPSVGAIDASLERSTSLRVVDLEDLGAHYVRTLQCWRDRLEARWDDALGLGYEDRFLRLWRFYLCYCEAAFAEGHVTDAQLVLEGPASRATPTLRAR